VLVECQKCGAPLEAKPEARVTKCNYCGSANQAGTMRTLAAVTPPGWTPPKVWVPPAGMSIQGQELAYKAGTAIAGFTMFMVLVPLVLTCVIFAFVGAALFWGLRSIPVPGGSMSGAGVSVRPAWTGTSPLVCGGSEELTYTGVTVSLPGQTAIQAAGNCHVTLVDCNITAAQGVVASGNGTVVLRGGSVSGATGALTTEGNGEIDVEGARIDGAVSASRPGRIRGVP